MSLIYCLYSIIRKICKKIFVRFYRGNFLLYLGWDNVHGFDMSHMRNVAKSEPLVDSIDPKQVVTTSALVREVDLYTYKVGESNFQNEFKLRCRKQDYIHALVCYFDVEFSKCHRRVGFSTCKFSQKRTVFCSFLSHPAINFCWL